MPANEGMRHNIAYREVRGHYLPTLPQKKMPPRRHGPTRGQRRKLGPMGPHPTSGCASNSQPWPSEASKLPNRPWFGQLSRHVLKTLIRCVAILGIAEQGAEARVFGTQVADPWLLASNAFVRVPPTHQCCVHLSARSASRGVSQGVGRCDTARACRARLQISDASG